MNCILNHPYDYEIQTMTQVFYQGENYTKLSCPAQEGITVESLLLMNRCLSIYYVDGQEHKRKFVDSIAVSSADSAQNHDVQQDADRVQGSISKAQERYLVKLSMFELLKEVTGFSPPWGLLTGVRPAKVKDLDREAFRIREDKFLLMQEISRNEDKILRLSKPEGLSLYIGIPFCPSRCGYCSFAAEDIQWATKKYGTSRVDSYLDCLCKELEGLSQRLQVLESIYIGGGTPTALSAAQLARLLDTVVRLFEVENLQEFTVEAGRPDTLDADKLRICKEHGVSRISINPQSMNDETLRRIGRKHTAREFLEAYELAERLGHDNINIDLILGLPGEGLQDVKNTFQEICSLSPKSVTVHTLAIKRASRFKEEMREQTTLKETSKKESREKETNEKETNEKETYEKEINQKKSTDEFSPHDLHQGLSLIEDMLSISREMLSKKDLLPYYMYRQKNMLGNFENVGYAKEGYFSFYNVMIMAEKQTILAAGAGAITKLVDRHSNHIERKANPKDVGEYIRRSQTTNAVLTKKE